MPGLPLGGPPHQFFPCSVCWPLAQLPCAWQFHSPSPGRSGEGGADVRPPNPAVPTPNFTASARAGPWLSRDPVTPSAPFPPSVPPHLHPGLHLVQHSHVPDIDLGLQELHGLLGTESRVRGDVAAPWDCPLQVLWARGGGKGTLHAPHRSPGQG